MLRAAAATTLPSQRMGQPLLPQPPPSTRRAAGTKRAQHATFL